MHRQMADMMKAMGGKGKGGGMMRQDDGRPGRQDGPAGGMGGMGGMPDLSKMDPKQLEALQKQAEAAGLGKVRLPGGMPGVARSGRAEAARSAEAAFPACRRRSEGGT
jgi:signal recognition particle subunit SRP54